MLPKAFKIIVIIWLIAAIAWIGIVIANIIILGWDIIGIRDIWPMALSTVVMVACILHYRSVAKRKPE